MNVSQDYSRVIYPRRADRIEDAYEMNDGFIFLDKISQKRLLIKMRMLSYISLWGMQQLAPGQMECFCFVVDETLQARATGRCLWTTYASEWLVGMDSCTRSVTFTKVSACRGFVGARLHVTGGVLRGGRSVEADASIAVLDTAAGVWLDRNGLVTTQGNKGHNDSDPSLESMRRC